MEDSLGSASDHRVAHSTCVAAYCRVLRLAQVTAAYDAVEGLLRDP